ncbi:hypothetical protein ACFXHA_25050 [Nocardia sp. NPDC059240]|uniref:hypothetical protein n=1 Tax=Nocardia sp. NPDC059240 TaxID=3346786 RepID=UPI0036C62E30
MKLYRDFIYGPLWLVILVLTAAESAYVAAMGLGWFGAALIVILTTIVGLAIAHARKRFGGRHEMRRFYDAVRVRQLPSLGSPEEVVRWNQLIVSERSRRSVDSATAWVQLAIGVLLLFVVALNTLKGLGFDFAGLPLAATMFIGFISTRWANPRALASLAAMAEQGTERGYGYSLPAQ